ncbi:hypothetical protein T459_16205 [Capsicum annuum]|uniref:Uncharacterized protein n=1 Tax=Capsicum annuum TaxID=4072 RepID=A0A2G2Z818_CAPAN|nr:hypothetical protein T459_16205 [Capsicum annuum]
MSLSRLCSILLLRKSFTLCCILSGVICTCGFDLRLSSSRMLSTMFQTKSVNAKHNSQKRPPPEFPLALPRSSIVHHLSGSDRYLAHVWKVGLELGPDDLTRPVIANTIRKLMVEEEDQELRQIVLDMKQELEMSFRDDGSLHNSLKSLTEFMPLL